MQRADRMAREFAVEIEWVPFELHPDIPPEGQVRDEALKRRQAGMRDRIEVLAEADNLPLQTNQYRSNAHNTLEAGEWAREKGPETFDAVHRAIFHAYFAAGKNVSTVDQVVEAIEAADVETPGLRDALEGGTYSQRVDELTQLARQNGINGTPTFIFEDQFMVSGAQEWPVFEDVLTRLGVPRRAGAVPEEQPAPASGGS
jgi:predicted DsbA family dithiol-disulfide isomerase